MRHASHPGLLFAAALVAAGCAHQAAGPSAARVDPEAIREALQRPAPRHYVSALAYRHYVEALLAKNRGDHERAAAALREALLFDPESPHLHTALAEELVRLGRAEKAGSELELALRLDGGHGPAHLLAAQLALSARREADARAHLLAALQADEDDADALRELVRLEASAARLTEAQVAAERLAASARRALDKAASARRERCGSACSRGGPTLPRRWPRWAGSRSRPATRPAPRSTPASCAIWPARWPPRAATTTIAASWPRASSAWAFRCSARRAAASRWRSSTPVSRCCRKARRCASTAPWRWPRRGAPPRPRRSSTRWPASPSARTAAWKWTAAHCAWTR